MLDIILIFIIGCIISGFGSITGFGGGVIMVPVLVVIFHVPITTAIGSVAVALLPSSIISSIFNHRFGFTDYTVGVLLEIPTIIGAIFGAMLTAIIAVSKLEYIFAGFVILMGIQMFLKEKEEETRFSAWLNRVNKIKPSFERKTENGIYHFSVILTSIFGLIVGTIAGMFGVGGGFLKGPVMIKVFKIPPRIAAATALFMIVFTSLTSSVTHYFLGHVHWTSALPVAASFIVGSLIGNQFTSKTRDEFLKKLIGFALFLSGFFILINSYIR
ncbi:MAG TPA: sulfite exporter TauE/SafE family protein [Balneolales bacterium]|nr:sulfite exporter TauE/SafE family protein [Balneolales bacterium]